MTRENTDLASSLHGYRIGAMSVTEMSPRDQCLNAHDRWTRLSSTEDPREILDIYARSPVDQQRQALASLTIQSNIGSIRTELLPILQTDREKILKECGAYAAMECQTRLMAMDLLLEMTANTPAPEIFVRQMQLLMRVNNLDFQNEAAVLHGMVHGYFDGKKLFPPDWRQRVAEEAGKYIRKGSRLVKRVFSEQCQ